MGRANARDLVALEALAAGAAGDLGRARRDGLGAAAAGRGDRRARAGWRELVEAAVREDAAGHPERGRADPGRLQRRARRARAASAPTAKGFIARARGGASASAPASPSLKVGYNKVFGYYIEVTKAQPGRRAGRLRAQADPGQRRALHHRRAQGATRTTVLGAEERRVAPGATSSSTRCASRSPGTAPRIRRGRARLAALDVLARAWRRRPTRSGYVPARGLHDGARLDIEDGRHPVVEAHDRRASASCPTTMRARRRREPGRSSSPGPTWPASPRCCARWR
ncbi:MAG: hypothetical protein MZU95_13515 [Desulfomicrobium escambiense]|nr:hypothetical protein [Desulfomicrobium escambiense]